MAEEKEINLQDFAIQLGILSMAYGRLELAMLDVIGVLTHDDYLNRMDYYRDILDNDNELYGFKKRRKRLLRLIKETGDTKLMEWFEIINEGLVDVNDHRGERVHAFWMQQRMDTFEFDIIRKGKMVKVNLKEITDLAMKTWLLSDRLNIYAHFGSLQPMT